MSLLEKIKSIGADIVTLDVTTLSGTITITAKAEEVNPKMVFEALKNATADANMTIVAHSHLDLDGDVLLFVKQSLTEAEKPLLDAHNAMVKSSQEARISMLRAIKDLVGLG